MVAPFFFEGDATEAGGEEEKEEEEGGEEERASEPPPPPPIPTEEGGEVPGEEVGKRKCSKERERALFLV